METNNYVPLNVDELRRKLQEDSKNEEQVELVFYNWKMGTPPANNNFRLLPPWSQEVAQRGEIAKEVYRHKMLDGAKHVCATRMWGDPCPVCQVIEELEAIGIDCNRFKPLFSAYVNVIDLDDPGKGPQICRFPWGLYQKIRGYIAHPKVGDITDPYNGVNITVTLDEDWNYEPFLEPNRGPIFVIRGTQNPDVEAINSVLRKIPNLDNVWKKPSDEIAEKIRLSAQVLKESYAGRVSVSVNSTPQVAYTTTIQQGIGVVDEKRIQPPGFEVSKDKVDIGQKEGTNKINIDQSAYKMSSLLNLENPTIKKLYDDWMEKDGTLQGMLTLIQRNIEVARESSKDIASPKSNVTVKSPDKESNKQVTKPAVKQISKPPSAPICYGTYGDTSKLSDTKCNNCPWLVPCQGIS